MLVVGLGPVGQLLALLLHREGVHVIAVDRADAPYPLPRAAATDDEVLRIFQSVGLAQEVLATSQVMDGVSFVTGAGRAVQVLRTERGLLGHPPLISLHQPSMEQVLVGALAARGVDARWGLGLEGLDQRTDGVTAWLRPSAGGAAEPVEARYLVGCDGAASAVRGRLGISYAGSTFAQRWLVVDALVDRPLARVPHPFFVGHAERPIVTLPMSPGRHRWEWMLHPGEAAEDFLPHAAIERRTAEWLDGERVEIERAVVYTFHSRTAGRWRAGRCFLAGDAAHVMPPFAGQGFSSGARDAANLSWKLAAVLRGAPAALLDTYEAERRPHVAAMQGLAERWGGVVQTTRPRGAALRDALLHAIDGSRVARFLQSNAKPLPTYGRGAFASRPHRLPILRGVGSLFPQPRVGERLLDDVLPAGWCALTTTAGNVAGLPTLRLGDEVPDTDGVLAAWLGKRGASWVILRPDRFIYACGTAADLPAARAALAATLGSAAADAGHACRPPWAGSPPPSRKPSEP